MRWADFIIEGWEFSDLASTVVEGMASEFENVRLSEPVEIKNKRLFCCTI